MEEKKIETAAAADKEVNHEVHTPATPVHVKTTIKKKRTRSAHKENCVCGVCNKKRNKAARMMNPPAIGDKIIQEEITQVEKDKIIRDYLDALPNDRGIVVFQQPALDEMKKHFYRLSLVYPNLTTEELSFKIINELIIKYTASL